LAVALLVTLAGCAGVKEAVGLGKKAPDDFAVGGNAPLTLPPDYHLRPPGPGAPGPAATAPRQKAEASLRSQQPAPRGESRALSPAVDNPRGAGETAPPDRASPGQNDLAERLIFWQKQVADLPPPGGTPTITQRKKKGTLEGVIEKVF
jgi:hypothetical protein